MSERRSKVIGNNWRKEKKTDEGEITFPKVK
jgi:hypothetical protein